MALEAEDGVDIGALSNRIFSGSFPRATSLRSAGLVCQNTQKRNGIVGNALHQEWNQSGNPSPIFIASRRKLEETLETIFRGASPSKVGNIIFAIDKASRIGLNKLFSILVFISLK